jgi:hypothetical protein
VIKTSVVTRATNDVGKVRRPGNRGVHSNEGRMKILPAPDSSSSGLQMKDK